jgi:hypothetical protein
LKDRFRTKSDSRSALICANRAKCLIHVSPYNALIAASFHRNHARTRSRKIGFDSRTRCHSKSEFSAGFATDSQQSQGMFTFSKPLDEIIEADLQRLIDDQWKKIASLNTSASSPALQTQIKKNLSATLFPSRTAPAGTSYSVSPSRMVFRRSPLRFQKLGSTKRSCGWDLSKG